MASTVGACHLTVSTFVLYKLLCILAIRTPSMGNRLPAIWRRKRYGKRTQQERDGKRDGKSYKGEAMAMYHHTDCDAEGYGTAETGENVTRQSNGKRDGKRYATLRTREKSRHCCVRAM